MKKKKPNGCAIGCLIVIIAFIALLIYGYILSLNDPLNDAEDVYDRIVDLNNNSSISAEEKATQAQDIINEITPVMEELEKEKDEKLPKMGKTFQTWQAYVSMNGACHAILDNDSEFYQKCINAAQESIERAKKDTD